MVCAADVGARLLKAAHGAAWGSTEDVARRLLHAIREPHLPSSSESSSSYLGRLVVGVSPGSKSDELVPLPLRPLLVAVASPECAASGDSDATGFAADDAAAA